MRYLGRISYGLYVYHYFAAVVVSRIATNLGWETLLRNEAATILAYSAFTITAAAVSWHLYERPINDLKGHFSYPTVPVAKQTPTHSWHSPISN